MRITWVHIEISVDCWWQTVVSWCDWAHFKDLFWDLGLKTDKITGVIYLSESLHLLSIYSHWYLEASKYARLGRRTNVKVYESVIAIYDGYSPI